MIENLIEFVNSALCRVAIGSSVFDINTIVVTNSSILYSYFVECEVKTWFRNFGLSNPNLLQFDNCKDGLT